MVYITFFLFPSPILSTNFLVALISLLSQRLQFRLPTELFLARQLYFEHRLVETITVQRRSPFIYQGLSYNLASITLYISMCTFKYQLWSVCQVYSAEGSKLHSDEVRIHNML